MHTGSIYMYRCSMYMYMMYHAGCVLCYTVGLFKLVAQNSDYITHHQLADLLENIVQVSIIHTVILSYTHAFILSYSIHPCLHTLVLHTPIPHEHIHPYTDTSILPYSHVSVQIPQNVLQTQYCTVDSVDFHTQDCFKKV